MLIHNQGLQNLNIGDKLIKGHLKEYSPHVSIVHM